MWRDLSRGALLVDGSVGGTGSTDRECRNEEVATNVAAKQADKSLLTRQLQRFPFRTGEGTAMGSLPISSSRRRALERQLRRAADARVYRRTLAVLEVDRGRAAAQVADELRVTRQSGYRWVAEYLAAGTPAALADRPRPGRPRGLGDGEAAFLRDVLDGSPRDLGYPHAGWTAPLLREALEAGTGTAVAERTIRRELARLD